MEQETNPTTPDALTARIHEKADADLRGRINAMLMHGDSSLSELVRAIEKNDKSFRVSIGHKPEVDVRLWDILVATSEVAFASCFERNRQAAIAAFVAKVDSLSADVADLQSAVGNLTQ